MEEQQIQKKFAALPNEIKQSLTSDQATKIYNQLEEKYSVDLGLILMAIIVKEIPLDEIKQTLKKQLNMPEAEAGQLEQDILKFLEPIEGYLRKTQKAGLVFDPGDAAEISKVNLSADQPTNNYLKMADDIIGQSGLTIDNPDSLKRLKGSIELRLKDIRDDLETESVLTRPIEQGGAGLNQEYAERIIGLTKDKMQISGLAAIAGRGKAQKKKIIEEIKAEDKKEQNKKKSQPIRPEVSKESFEIEVPVKHQEEIEKPVSLGQKPAAREERLQDIKFSPKLTSPVEELRNFSVEDFRRLSSDPYKAADKIADRVRLLEVEDYQKKIDGIKAWSESEVYKLYLSIGQESIDQGIPVSEVIKRKETSGQATLSEEEFHAIMDLNKTLRY